MMTGQSSRGAHSSIQQEGEEMNCATNSSSGEIVTTLKVFTCPRLIHTLTQVHPLHEASKQAIQPSAIRPSAIQPPANRPFTRLRTNRLLADVLISSYPADLATSTHHKPTDQPNELNSLLSYQTTSHTHTHTQTNQTVNEQASNNANKNTSKQIKDQTCEPTLATFSELYCFLWNRYQAESLVLSVLLPHPLPCLGLHGIAMALPFLSFFHVPIYHAPSRQPISVGALIRCIMKSRMHFHVQKTNAPAEDGTKIHSKEDPQQSDPLEKI